MDKPAGPEPTRFADLDLSPIMLKALARAGFETATPIQAGLIPLALEGYDVIGQARTGTGKTAAFGIPILEQLDPLEECHDPQALILVPTRELADQVGRELERLAWGVPTRITVLAGGKNMNSQLRELKAGVQIAVGTPGRVADHLSRRTLRTDSLWCLVLDEADRMLDIGFRPQIEKILRQCPSDRQTLLLSATLPPTVRKLAERYMTEPEVIDCSTTGMSVATIEQHYFTVAPDRKFELLERLLERDQPEQAIIFCRTKRGTDKLQRKLSSRWKRCDCIHGDMNQRDRDRVMQSVRDRKLQILVATDVVGRGIDVSTISHIINYDVPQDSDDYVHRVGRTGRMGREGVAYTFIAPGEGDFLTGIEARIDKLLIKDSIEGFDPLPEVTARRQAEAERQASADSESATPTRRTLNPMMRKSTRRRR
ncbi:DEAD/DEAH box helicase [Candidatus Laterigemmans baculatus]|uniref:DEAD/DEAH box helicase n=1 Tax=Candidatus Laterigemmans baculatus TaxID=2770505 RepID=UPI0013D90F8F|nr:DEAD/DEAH box helicase [Candidatus Laterigemmans baculatus]